MFSLLTMLESANVTSAIDDLASFFAMPNYTIQPATIRTLQATAPSKKDRILYRVLFADSEAELDRILARCSLNSTLSGTSGKHTSPRCTSWTAHVDAAMNVIQDYSESSDFEYAVIVKSKIKAADIVFDSTDSESEILRNLLREVPSLRRSITRQREVVVRPGTYDIQIVEVVTD